PRVPARNATRAQNAAPPSRPGRTAPAAGATAPTVGSWPPRLGPAAARRCRTGGAPPPAAAPRRRLTAAPRPPGSARPRPPPEGSAGTMAEPPARSSHALPGQLSTLLLGRRHRPTPPQQPNTRKDPPGAPLGAPARSANSGSVGYPVSGSRSSVKDPP